MRIAELSRASGVSVASIKYYLRERLLPPGTALAANQADYGNEHLRRLKLIRVLLTVGSMGVAQVREVVHAIDTEVSLHEVLGTMQQRLPGLTAGGQRSAAARAELDRIYAERGWIGYPDDPNRLAAEAALSAWQAAFPGDYRGYLDQAAVAAELVAEVDVAGVAAMSDRDSMVDLAVVGTVFGDALFAALRRLAQVHVSNRLLGQPADAAGESDEPATRQSSSGPLEGSAR